MANMQYVLRDCSLFIDEKEFSEPARQIKLPVIKEKTEDYRGGGSDFDRKMRFSFEALEAEFEFAEIDPMLLQKAGFVYGKILPITARGYLLGEDENQEANAVAHLRGRISGEDYGTWEPAKMVPVKFTMDVRVFEFSIAGTLLHRINTKDRVFVRGGVDQNIEKRRLLGLV